MAIFPHKKTPEEKVFFDRLAAMKIELMPGMHVLDALYPHRDESGGSKTDHIIISSTYAQPSRYPGETYDGVGTISEDYKCKSGSAASYFVPKLTHHETFLMCLRIAQDRGAKTIRVDGYESVFHKSVPEANIKAQWEPGELHVEYPGVISDAWLRPEWQAAIIEGLTQALIDSAPED